MIFYEPATRDRSILPDDPFKSLVVPRPSVDLAPGPGDTGGARPPSPAKPDIRSAAGEPRRDVQDIAA
jgi:hypothetical protein